MPPTNRPDSMARSEGRVTSTASVHSEWASGLTARIRKVTVLLGLSPRRETNVLLAGEVAMVSQSCPSGRTWNSYCVSSLQLSSHDISREVLERKGMATRKLVGSHSARRKPHANMIEAVATRAGGKGFTMPNKGESSRSGNTEFRVAHTKSCILHEDCSCQKGAGWRRCAYRPAEER